MSTLFTKTTSALSMAALAVTLAVAAPLAARADTTSVSVINNSTSPARISVYSGQILGEAKPNPNGVSIPSWSYKSFVVDSNAKGIVSIHFDAGPCHFDASYTTYAGFSASGTPSSKCKVIGGGRLAVSFNINK